jgi:hypothetical protein
MRPKMNIVQHPWTHVIAETSAMWQKTLVEGSCHLPGKTL